MTGETLLSFASLVENNSLKSNPNLDVFCSLFLLPSGIVFHCPFFLDFQGVSNDDCLHEVEPFPQKTFNDLQAKPVYQITFKKFFILTTIIVHLGYIFCPLL